ncbi:MAG TPA: hypothetical protein VK698_39330 [Kofleriaceae bacterium]|nr:hypothetical protein [Kofleriaceae bacterium]
MGARISHYDGAPSWHTIENLGVQLEHVTTSGQWRHLKPLFDGSLRGPVSVSPRDAARIGDYLESAAGHRLMPGNWADLARKIAKAAHRAANRNQQWTWE